MATSPALLLLSQIAVIVACGRVLGVVFRRIGQPSVVAEIVAGILLGPSLLGWVFPAAMNTLFPPSRMGLLSVLSQVGLVFFMFLVGLEFDTRLLRGRGTAYLTISWASIAVPFSLGIGLAWFLFETTAPPGVAFSAFALFVGAAMSITAFPVLARILSERDVMRTRVGAVTLACAAVDDASAWCMLAFVAAFAEGSGVASAMTMTVLALIYLAVMFLIVRPLLLRLAPAPGTVLSADLVAVVFLAVLGSAVVTEAIGIHALIGGFVLGVIVPRSGGLAHALGERMQDLVTVVFLPLFFAYSGLRTEIGLLADPGSWGVLGLVIAVACVGKFGGSAVAARLAGLGWRESAALGVLLNTRGLMELVVVNIGLDLGVISPRLFTMFVLMALFTTLLTSPLSEWIYPSARMAMDMAEEAAPPDVAREPAALVWIANEESVPALLDLADVLTRHRRGPVWALHLPGEGGADPAPLVRATDEAARRGVDLRPLSFPSSSPADDVGRVAELKGVPLVLMAGGGAVPHTSATVAVLTDRGLGPIRRVVCLDGQDADGRAAGALARQLAAGGATVTRVSSAGEIPDGADLLVVGLSGIPTGPSWHSVLAVRAAREV